MSQFDTDLFRGATRARVAQREAHRRKGFNLVEAAIVLGVVGLVIGGIWIAAAKVRESQETANFKTFFVWFKNEAKKIDQQMRGSGGSGDITPAIGLQTLTAPGGFTYNQTGHYYISGQMFAFARTNSSSLEMQFIFTPDPEGSYTLSARPGACIALLTDAFREWRTPAYVYVTDINENDLLDISPPTAPPSITNIISICGTAATFYIQYLP